MTWSCLSKTLANAFLFLKQSMLMSVPVPEADAPKLKRERRLVSENSNHDILAKTVKVWPVVRPDMEKGDEMYGRSKLAAIEYVDGCSAMQLQQSLSDDDKG